MPNGGFDNCAACHFNKAARDLGDQFLDQPEERTWLFLELCHCLIRDVKINDPYWTYCDNYTWFRDRDLPSYDTQPIGFVFINGRPGEGYVRIPWDDNNEPHIKQAVRCHICDREVEDGIGIEHTGTMMGFCCNRHYVEWWLTQHEDNKIIAEYFDTPEKFFKE